jgi:glycosyltransferase involved in cell wall biosynthesis
MTRRVGGPGLPSSSFVFISSNYVWGGSEELWSEAAAALARRGHRVTVYKNRLSRREGNVAAMQAAGCSLVELARFPLLPNQLYSLVAKFAQPLSVGYQAVRLHFCLKLRRRPALVVVSQGGNHDGWLLATVCRRLGLPYVLVSQKATDLYWPDDRWRDRIRDMYGAARHAFFVARHNLQLAQEQIGATLASASVVRNPFKVEWDASKPWPQGDICRFACVGRLYPKEKGQDLLLRVLAKDKWRQRPVTLTVFGAGEQRAGLEAMAAYLGLRGVRFAGYADDIDRLWEQHHALVLPSRAEGLPLVVVEAMLSGRVAIVTDVGGNAEAVADDVNGFVAAAPTEAALDEAMERAWQRRAEWPEIGRRAAEAMRGAVPPDPAAAFADQVLRLAAGEDLSGGEDAPLAAAAE